MKKMLKRFVKDERALETGEYAILLAIICVILVITLIAFKDKIAFSFKRSASAMDSIDAAPP